MSTIYIVGIQQEFTQDEMKSLRTSARNILVLSLLQTVSVSSLLLCDFDINWLAVRPFSMTLAPEVSLIRPPASRAPSVYG